MPPLNKRAFLFVPLFLLFSFSFASDTITLNRPLTDEETLVSDDGVFALGFFTPTNSTNRYVGIWYNNFPTQTVVWVANRQHPVTTISATLVLLGNGTLAIFGNNSTLIWSSPSMMVHNPIARLLDSGNFVVGDAQTSTSNSSEFYAWQSFDYPTDTIIPGMKIGWDLKTGLSRNVTSWKSDSDPSPGDWCIAMEIGGSPQLILSSSSVRKLRSGIWNGSEFNRFPEPSIYTDFTVRLVNNNDEIYFSYDVTSDSIMTRLLVNQSGVAQGYVGFQQFKTWSLIRYAPATDCDIFSVCGPYGVCSMNDRRTCDCLDGFKPENSGSSGFRDISDGCVRKTQKDCVNGTDGFNKMSNLLLPDALNATFHAGTGLDECRANCLKNCSCAGYARAVGRMDEIGCLIWSSELVDMVRFSDGGQDLYFRVAAADLVVTQSVEPTMERPQKNRQKIIAITGSLALGAMLIACIGCCILKNRKRMKGGGFSKHGILEIDKDNEDLELPLYDLATVTAATNNFSNENKLGKGGFGPVYKGILLEGRQEIAVKRLSKTSMQGIDEFKNEVVLIAKLQHRNLVRLIGCCISGDERMLIYEYMPNRSLDAFLFDKSGKSFLDWQTRYHIIAGIARGILYLHEDSRLRIIHRDLKSSNILLDKDMIPKISDFGMARIFGGDEAATQTNRVVGTYGYMSPEYAMNGIFSVKSDVFSFGVLVLEIVSGQKTNGVFLSELESYLLGNAWRLWNEGKSLELTDPSLGSKFSATEVIRCITIGLLCVQERPEDRPTMSSVVVMLASNDASYPAPKQPGFVARRNPSSKNSSSTERASDTASDLTLTVLEGR